MSDEGFLVSARQEFARYKRLGEGADGSDPRGAALAGFSWAVMGGDRSPFAVSGEDIRLRRPILPRLMVDESEFEEAKKKQAPLKRGARRGWGTDSDRRVRAGKGARPGAPSDRLSGHPGQSMYTQSIRGSPCVRS